MEGFYEGQLSKPVKKLKVLPVSRYRGETLSAADLLLSYDIMSYPKSAEGEYAVHYPKMIQVIENRVIKRSFVGFSFHTGIGEPLARKSKVNPSTILFTVSSTNKTVLKTKEKLVVYAMM